MGTPTIPAGLLRELEWQRRMQEKLTEVAERIDRHNMVVDALRFVECMKGGGTFESCSGIYRLAPKPPPALRRDLKAALSKEDYAALSKAWSAR